RLFDPGRMNAHATAALGFLGEASPDDHTIIAIARLTATRFLGTSVLLRTIDEEMPRLARARGPLARCLLEVLRAVGADARGDGPAFADHAATALDESQRLGLHAIAVAVLADRVMNALYRGTPPDAVLAIVARARRHAEDGKLGAIEPHLRLLASQ